MWELIMLLFILDSLSWADTIVGGVVGLFMLVWAAKYAIPWNLFSTTDKLLEKRTIERDDALRERDIIKNEVAQLEDEIRTLRREIIQRIDISYQDQQTIMKLKHPELGN